MGTHTGERMSACSACNKSFASVEESETQKPFTCSKCDKRSANTGGKESYADTEEPEIHKRTHTGEKLLACPTCNRTFTREEEPMRAHTDEKPFECPTCNMRFTGKEQLETHEKPH